MSDGLVDAPTTWVMRDGTEVVIADMTDAHVQNAIAMLERTAKTGLTMYQLEALNMAAYFGGRDPDSMASYFADGAADHAMQMVEDDFLSECTPYYALLDERNRRIDSGCWSPTFEVSQSLVEKWLERSSR